MESYMKRLKAVKDKREKKAERSPNRFEISLERLKDVEPNDNWTDADYAHIATIREALEYMAEHTEEPENP